MRKFCSRTYLGVRGQLQASRTRRLNRETGSTQCRTRDAYRRITGRGHLYPALAGGVCRLRAKNRPPQGATREAGGASSPRLKPGASALAPGDSHRISVFCSAVQKGSVAGGAALSPNMR
jgi:hypothetical protein